MIADHRAEDDGRKSTTTTTTAATTTALLLLRTNRRKLPKSIRNCRDDAGCALRILANAYPHLAFSSRSPEITGRKKDAEGGGSNVAVSYYRQLLDILYNDNNMDGVVAVDDYGCIIVRREEVGDEEECTPSSENDDAVVVIIDGESIVATMEVLGKARDIPAAVKLLRLSVEGMRRNRKRRRRDDDRTPPMSSSSSSSSSGEGSSEPVERRLEDDGDGNELSRIYKAAFSLLGHAHDEKKQRGGSTSATYCTTRLIMHLLRYHMPHIARLKPGAEIYHAAINALGKIGEYDLILEILDEVEQCNESILRYGAAVSMTTATNNNAIVGRPPTSSSDKVATSASTAYYQTAISSLSRHNRCQKAMQLLCRMQSRGLSPDTNTYNGLLIGIAKEAGRCDDKIANANAKNDDGEERDDASVVFRDGGEGDFLAVVPWHQVALRILHEMETTLDKHPTEQSYNSVMSACGKEGNWSAAAIVAEKAEMRRSSRGGANAEVSGPSDHARVMDANETATSSAYFDNLMAFCKVGKGSDSWWEIGRYSVSCASDENAASDAESRGRGRSIIIGVQPHRNPLVAIWLHLCLMTNTYPRAAVMNKPLISCVLMGFNFVPQNGGSRVGLIRLTNDNTVGGESDENSPKFGLYSPSAKSLQGLFSQRYLRVQNIAILDRPPAPISGQSGTVVYVKTGFEHPIAISENAVEYTPPQLFTLDYKLISEERSVCDGNEQLQQRGTRQSSSTQRSILANQIDSILKIDVEGSTASANMEYFANVTYLKGAFLSYDFSSSRE